MIWLNVVISAGFIIVIRFICDESSAMDDSDAGYIPYLIPISHTPHRNQFQMPYQVQIKKPFVQGLTKQIFISAKKKNCGNYFSGLGFIIFDFIVKRFPVDF